MNKIFIVFALLDCWLLVDNWRGILHTFQGPRGLLFRIISILPSLTIISFAFSASGLFLRKKWALILYYFQFPLRIAYIYLSLGFLLTLAAKIFGLMTTMYFVVFGVVILAEMIRLIISIKIHKLIKNKNT